MFRKPVILFKEVKALALAAALLSSPMLSAQIIGRLPSQPNVIHLSVHAGSARVEPIPQTIFGTFLEPIRRATYGGLWAELIENPSFEPGLWDASHVAGMIGKNRALADASQLDLPLPWEPLYSWQRNRYEPRRGDAANSDQSLLIMALPTGEVGIRQAIYLPAEGEVEYKGSLWVKHVSGPDEVSVSLREHNDAEKILARSLVHAPGSAWSRYEFSFKLTAGEVKPLVPVDFVISLSANSRAIVDQVSLMPADNLDGLDPKIVAMVRDLHSPIIRFGGNYTSGYHFRDGLGPLDKRISMRNLAWGIPEYNTFGTDEFLRFCQLVGAEPQIALNLGSGTPEESADWVHYVNEHWTGRKDGHLWELGNELWGPWNMGYPWPSELAARTTAFSEAVRKVDPNAKLIATGEDPDAYRIWNGKQLTSKPGTFDYLSTHFVVSTNSVQLPTHSPSFLSLANFALPIGLESKLRAMAEQIETTGHKNVRLAFTEWLFNNESNVEGAPAYFNMGGAIDAGGFLNMLMRVSDIVPIADMTGTLECAGVYKRQGQVFGTPTYYVMRMYSNEHPASLVRIDNDGPAYNVEQGTTRLPQISNVPWLDSVAAETADHDKLVLFMVNRSLEHDLTAQIKIDGFAPSGTAKIQTLNSASLDDQNSAEAPTKVIPKQTTIPSAQTFEYTFPRSSVVVIELSRTGN